jgi:hypothetical protein
LLLDSIHRFCLVFAANISAHALLLLMYHTDLSISTRPCAFLNT